MSVSDCKSIRAVICQRRDRTGDAAHESLSRRFSACTLKDMDTMNSKWGTPVNSPINEKSKALRRRFYIFERV